MNSPGRFSTLREKSSRLIEISSALDTTLMLLGIQ
jgi:hypothetical protein